MLVYVIRHKSTIAFIFFEESEFNRFLLFMFEKLISVMVSFKIVAFLQFIFCFFYFLLCTCVCDNWLVWIVWFTSTERKSFI